ncbi:MAG: tetratricopeptide repeat protein [Candidatus Krumholzibacteriota bacterium]
MSKLSQLKQKAYQAGKDRNWEQAISIYEQILEVEKSNPTVINELGDLFLKSGDTRQAIKHFLSAATKYRKTGLLNNSVAICKKILRHEDKNMHAHWYLAEIRSSQDLVVEGETHATAFLESGSQMSGEIQEIFQKRCLKLLELYPTSLRILEPLGQIFRTFDKKLEAGRAGCLQACLMFDAGDPDAACKMVDGLLAGTPEIRNYPEFGNWNRKINPGEATPGEMADYNSVSLGADNEEPAAEADAADEVAAEETPAADAADGPEVAADTASAPETPSSTDDAKDEDGCLVIDSDDGPDMADLIAAASREADKATETVESAEAPAEEEPAESVDLLSQILAEDSSAVLGDESKQVDTIAAEIGSVVGGGGDDDDADRLYEMGLVYLEMGLFDKACDSFETAAADDDYTIRAHEMWGVTLQRAGNPDEAVTVLNSGLQFAEVDSREYLGLRYHMGMAHEAADRPDAALEIYEDIQAKAPNFLDVGNRLRELASA